MEITMISSQKQKQILLRRIETLEVQMNRLALKIIQLTPEDMHLLAELKKQILDDGFCLAHGQFFCDEH
jgi:hypothetical protein